MRKTYTSMVAKFGLGSGDELPEWYTIFPEGEVEIEGEGSFIVSKEAFTLLKAQIERRGLEIVFDYEHQTLKDIKSPAAGWCRDWRWEDGVGIQARIDWTEEATGFLKKGEYRYYSPVFFVRKSDQLLAGVHSVALTNAPKTNHLQPLLAKLGAETNHQQTEESMNLLKMLIAALKLNEDATEDEVVAAVKKLQDGSQEEVVAKSIVEALGLEGGDVSTVVASIHALKQTEKTMVSKSDFEALQAKLAEKDAKTVVAKAMKEGKITPDQKDWATTYATTDPQGFATFVTKAPVVIPQGTLPKDEQQDNPALGDATVLAVAKLMDVDSEDLKTYGGLQ